MDVSEHRVEFYCEIPVPVIKWVKEHTVHDLRALLLEMHEDGEDITEYAPMVEELEHLEKKWKLEGELPARTEADTDPLDYVEKELESAFA